MVKMRWRQTGKKATALAAAILLFTGLPAAVHALPSDIEGQVQSVAQTNTSALTIEAARYTASEGPAPSVQRVAYEGTQQDVLLTPEGGKVEWTVSVSAAGSYQLYITYLTAEGHGTPIERCLRINGEVPFKEAENITLYRQFTNESNEPEYDANGHQQRPRQVEVMEWQTTAVKDERGLQLDPLLFQLEQGENRIQLEALREDVILKSLVFSPKAVVPSYADYSKQYENLSPVIGAQPLVLEGEAAYRKSDSILYPYHDRVSPLTSPFDISKIRMNYIGGENWKIANQWIEWEFEVAQPGLYQVALRSRQNYKRGIFVCRNIYLDGSIPFAELEHYEFSYDRNWINAPLGTKDGEPFSFFLEKGRHTLRLEVSLGNMVEVIAAVNASILEINRLYRNILMVTGPIPDTIRDYELEKVIPDFLETLEEQSRILKEQKAKVETYTGQKGGELAAFDRMAVQLDIIRDDPSILSESSLENLRSNAGSLAAWILSISEQPLDIDYITVKTAEMPLAKSDVGFWGRLVNEVQAYIASFFEDYSIVGQTTGGGETLEVWVPTGRDQAQIIKQLADDSFSPRYQTAVNVRLVRADVLLPAIVAKNGPDVAIQVARDLPVNYGTRTALTDLSAFPECGEVQARFHESAVIPLGFGGQLFGLPETQSFNMLFYRKDILAEYGFTPPQTWQELHDMAAILKKDNLEVGIPFDINTYSAFLFQRDGEFYTTDGTSSLLDSEKGIQAFSEWTDLRTSYRYPIQFDLINRFRTGEMPLGIGDFTTCNYLSVFAPEIKGLWEMAPIPGTATANGVRREETSGGTAAILVAASPNQQQGWDFLNWWTSETTQLQYGREIESLLGPSARYPTANLAAFAQLSWDRWQIQSIGEQRNWLKAIPEVPGGYFMPRHLNNALRAVIYSLEDPRTTMVEYTEVINRELQEKQAELGYSQGRKAP